MKHVTVSLSHGLGKPGLTHPQSTHKGLPSVPLPPILLSPLPVPPRPLPAPGQSYHIVCHADTVCLPGNMPVCQLLLVLKRLDLVLA